MNPLYSLTAHDDWKLPAPKEYEVEIEGVYYTLHPVPSGVAYIPPDLALPLCQLVNFIRAQGHLGQHSECQMCKTMANGYWALIHLGHDPKCLKPDTYPDPFTLFRHAPVPAAPQSGETFVKKVTIDRKNRTCTEDRTKPEPQDERAAPDGMEWVTCSNCAGDGRNLAPLPPPCAYCGTRVDRGSWIVGKDDKSFCDYPCKDAWEKRQARAALNQPKTVIDHGGDGKEFPSG